MTISGSLRKHHTYMQYIIKWSVQHKSVSQPENNCKSLLAKWFTNYILDYILDKLTDHKTSWNDAFAQILKSTLDAILNN